MTTSKPEDGPLGQLHAALSQDRPETLAEEAARWAEVATALATQAGVLESRMADARGAWTSDGSEAYLSQLESQALQLRTVAETAQGNSVLWQQVADGLDSAKIEAAELMSQWEAVKASTPKDEWEQKRWSYDIAADALWTTTQAVGAQGLLLESPTDYRPMPPVDLPGDDRTGTGGPTGTGPTGSVTDPNGAAPPSGAFSPGTDGGFSPDGPDLQGPPLTPLPQPPPTTPGPLPSPGMPGPTPPPPGIPPIPPGTPPPWGGLKPPAPPPHVPPGTKPVPPPRTGLPTPQLPKPTPGLKPPGTGPVTPRPPQTTVRPVIGSRPGTTGMAPTNPSRYNGTGVTRPVIGNRPPGTGTGPGWRPGTAPGGPGWRPGMPATGGPGTTGLRPGMPPGAGANGTPRSGSGSTRPLIGRNGVVGGRPRRPGMRSSKLHSGGDRLNRSVVSGVRQAFGGPAAPAAPKRRDEKEQEGRYVPEGGDYVWRAEGDTVPAVISGGPGWDDREHAAAAVPDLSAPESQDVDEAANIDRLAHRADKPDGDQALPSGPWNTAKTTPGVIRPKPQADEFGFRW
ncbi:hypothetical protein LX16_1729 [Stackebrandtia albiflava]|uniref:PPE family protein n=1 Tax=Stackebrandtia albiflava TaxID=406432 RepID=A0A562VDP6_9ACTN|nr:hypothetical protein [Stackebrandtia albiflava]TWJ16009.1 hypothetical protein LX16_1729 [Stackebrandtia albiflava]